ncbi:MAG: DUF2083 domain-containing protein [Sphingomonadaceae bacterium]|nr:DUF2083 domain-containing protein [Sphingomonadaceae bacterium]
MQPPRKRAFAGPRVRALRHRARLGQQEMATRLGISVSYLSQIETNDRPLTPAVIAALGRAFPHDWAEVGEDEQARLLAAFAEAAADSLALDPDDETLRRAVTQQPALAERYLALHAAWRRAENQLQRLDDAYEAGAAGERRLPWDEVRDWFHDAGNYIDALDRGAEALAERIAGPEALAAALARHGIGVRFADPDRPAPLRAFDAERGVLHVDRTLPEASRTFQLAHQLARVALATEIAAVRGGAGLRTPEASALLEVGLANYAAGALLMPYAAFREEARRTRHDIDRLRLRFGVSFEQACHRLSTLQRPGERGTPFFFCRVDMAGNITKRHSATRLQFARFGGACPLWIMHEAVAIPDRILVQLAEMPDGVRYVVMAKGLVKESASYARSPRRYAVALGCETEQARDFVYADQLDLKGAQTATPIGISCRLCVRADCDQRAFPPSGRAIHVDPDRRAVVPYRLG